MNYPPSSGSSSVDPRSTYTTASFSDTQSLSSPSHFSSTHRASFLDMSPQHRAPAYPGPGAYSADVYIPDISPPGSPPILPCQRMGWSEAESYALSSDQVSRIVTGIKEHPASDRSRNHSERSLDPFDDERHRRCCANISSASDAALCDKFPALGQAVVAAVSNHRLEAAELYKLGTDITRQKGRVASDRYDQTHDARGTNVEDYPTLQSLIDPLTTYFRILIASCPNVYDLQELADGSQQYFARLVTFSATYEWAAVLAYHFDFYRARVREMKSGNHSGWAHTDPGLHVRHLAGREKGHAAAATPNRNDRERVDSATASDAGLATRKKEFCELFNGGVCVSPCRYRRIHQCQGCGSNEHSMVACPTSQVLVYSTRGPALPQ